MYVFVSTHRGPEWWCKGKCSYLNVMPKIFFIIFILGDLIQIPITEWALLWINRNEINQTGFANYFQLCGMLQLAFVILVLYQLRKIIWSRYEDI
jgi:hypothetical protein